MSHSHSISLADAAKLTKCYRETSPAGILVGTILPVKGEAFVKEAIQEVIDQSGCEGIRIYYGLDLHPVPKFRLVIVGIDSNMDDMTDGVILENGYVCPPICGIASALNS